MKQYIRYLYEYENGKRIRNVGFVRVEEDDRKCIIHIHGKGLRLKTQTDMEVYVFFKDGNNACMGIRQGEIKNVNPSINYRLEYGHDDVGGSEKFGEIEGIILSNYSRPKYAAVWNEAPVDIENMVVVEKEANFPRTPGPEQQTQSGSGSVNSDISTREEETNEEQDNQMVPELKASEEKMQMPEHRVEMVPEQKTEEPSMLEQYRKTRMMPEREPNNQMMPESEPNNQMMSETESEPNNQMMPETESSGQNTPEPELTEQMMPMPEPNNNEQTATVVPMPEPNSNEQTATVVPMPEPNNNERSATVMPMPEPNSNESANANEQQEEGIRFQKITREEIARLPRREWRLANNSFLLHGYYNYNHLVIMEEGENQFLGVPGIYHAKEKPAAEAFGFGNFVRWTNDKLELDNEERAEGKDFGYWYRQVSRSKA
ncbi:MAG: DUF6128 domain-containing protein [Lachnospiraceae bacterium]